MNKKFFSQFFIGALTAAFMDLIWVGLIANNYYQSQLGSLLRMHDGKLTPIWWSAVFDYLLIPFGIIFFVIPKSGTAGKSAFWGALFGIILYGVYEFTNYALLANWPLSIVWIDTLWGGVICSGVAFTIKKFT